MYWNSFGEKGTSSTWCTLSKPASPPLRSSTVRSRLCSRCDSPARTCLRHETESRNSPTAFCSCVCETFNITSLFHSNWVVVGMTPPVLGGQQSRNSRADSSTHHSTRASSWGAAPELQTDATLPAHRSRWIQLQYARSSGWQSGDERHRQGQRVHQNEVGSQLPCKRAAMRVWCGTGCREITSWLGGGVCTETARLTGGILRPRGLGAARQRRGSKWRDCLPRVSTLSCEPMQTLLIQLRAVSDMLAT